MEWWAILLIILAAIGIIAATVALSIKSNKAKQEKLEELLKELEGVKAAGYCFINESVLLRHYDSETISKRSYTTRPYIWFTSNKFKSKKIVIIIPQRTKHNLNTFDGNFYFSDNKYFLDIKEYLIVKYSDISIKSKMNYIDEYTTRINEANIRIDEIKNILIHYI